MTEYSLQQLTDLADAINRAWEIRRVVTGKDNIPSVLEQMPGMEGHAKEIAEASRAAILSHPEDRAIAVTLETYREDVPIAGQVADELYEALPELRPEQVGSSR
jgi:hypothetical protein